MEESRHLPKISKEVVQAALQKLNSENPDLVRIMEDHETGRVELDQEAFADLYHRVGIALMALSFASSSLELTVLKFEIRMEIRRRLKLSIPGESN